MSKETFTIQHYNNHTNSGIIMKQTLKTSLLLGLLVLISHPTKTEIDTTTILAGTVGTALGGIGLYAFYSWLTQEETNQELLQKGTLLINSTEQTHAILIEKSEDYNEQTLSDLYHNEIYFAPPTEDLSKVRCHIHLIETRCSKLLAKSNKQEETTQLMDLLQQLQSVYEKLVQANTFWSIFTNYCVVYTTEQNLSITYNEILPVINSPTFERKLQEQVLVKHNTHSHYNHPVFYKYYEYAAILDLQINNFSNELHKATKNRYPNLHARAQALLVKLTKLHTAIINSKSYQIDCQERKADELEREHLRLEQQRLDIAQQQIYSQQRLADAYERKTWHKLWHIPQKKETVVVVTAPAQPAQQQPPVIINNNINNPVCTQEVSPVVKQQPKATQSPTVTVTAPPTTPQPSAPQKQNRWEDDMFAWTSLNSNF